MSNGSIRSTTSMRVPEKILKRIFELINQVRSEYDLLPLTFSKELSFLAGEHACNMSTKRIPYGHDGFQERESQAPLATAFSENVAVVPSTDDPGQNIVVAWLEKSKAFSRILSGFTHTGIGIAESEDGSWFCTQIFATYKVRLTYKDQLLLMTRYINRIRYSNNLTPLAISLVGAARIIFHCKENPNFLSTLTNAICSSLFYRCSSAEFIIESVPKGDSALTSFIDKLQNNEEYLPVIQKDIYTEFVFSIHHKSESEYNCVALFGACAPAPRSIPKIHLHYPEAYNCLQIVNDYRIVHSVSPLELSHQWCAAASKHSAKMMTQKGEVEVRSLSKKILHQMPEDEIHCAACVIPYSTDPLRELLLMWISNPKTKARLLSSVKHFGFAMSIADSKFCYITRIIGTKSKKVSQGSRVIRSEPTMIQYLTLTSENAESPDNVNADAYLSFRLTG